MKKLFIFALIPIILWLAGFLWFDCLINSYDRPENIKTDAIVVLTGGSNRISNAITLLNNGLAEKLFISGVSKDTSLEMIEKRNGVNVSQKQSVQIGCEAKDTIGNALEAGEWIEKNNIHSIRLVTSNYHLPRSIVEFQYRNPNIAIIPHPVYSNKVHRKWWKNPGSFWLMAREYNKFLYVYFSKKLLKSEA